MEKTAAENVALPRELWMYASNLMGLSTTSCRQARARRLSQLGTLQVMSDNSNSQVTLCGGCGLVNMMAWLELGPRC
jgi:hypothetical protein